MNLHSPKVANWNYSIIATLSVNLNKNETVLNKKEVDTWYWYLFTNIH